MPSDADRRRADMMNKDLPSFGDNEESIDFDDYLDRVTHPEDYRPAPSSKGYSKAASTVASSVEGGDDEEKALIDQTEFLIKGKKKRQMFHLQRPHHRLATNKQVFQWSLMALRAGVFCDSVSNTILQPNFPFLALPGAHPDSFPNTDPFDFSAATYFLPLGALLGTAISSTFVGSLSDRIGRKPVITACVGVSVIGTIVKYLARKTFWGFWTANFVNGLFGSSLSVAMAYVSDIHPDRKSKDAEIGVMVGLFMLGTSFGGIAAILMEENGLFTPLFIGAGLNFAATIGIIFFLIEPKKMLHMGINFHQSGEEEEEENAPEKINRRVLVNIIGGSLFDNIGSSGLYPLCLAPLAFDAFLVDLVEQGQSPLMSEVAYKWISVMLGLMVIFGAAITNPVFERVGPAAGCVFGNLFTAILTIGVLYVALIEPPTNATFGSFIALLYVGFPLTVISQLSTGPMLDRIAPVDRRGFIQGLNVTIMSFSNAVSPWLLGILADEAGTVACIWTCIGISFLAAIANTPLMFESVLRASPKLLPDYSRALKYEDDELVARALRGEWVPAKALQDLNEARMHKGQHFLVIPYRPYAEDKDKLREISKHAKEDFKEIRDNINYWLSELDTDEKKSMIADELHHSLAPPAAREELAKGLGAWFADYLVDAGYHIEDSPIVYKQMIMQAFPVINRGGEVTVDNIEQVAVNVAAVFNRYLEETETPGINKAFAGAF